MKKQKTCIAQNFSCHAWNGDMSRVALCPDENEFSEVWLFDTNGSPDEMKAWGKPQHKLKEHGGFVSAIDWHAESNQIVTVGHDRNAYVWKEVDEKDKRVWKPTLVILRINRAATSVRWSPNGSKFAVTSGAKCVPVCHFEDGNNWWISKMIKKHKSTVLTLAWCPNNKYLVTGSTDFKCRIFSAFIEALDDKKDDTFKWAKANSFGSVLAEFDQAKAWVQAVDWTGTQICFAGHGSTTHFVDLDVEGSDHTVHSVYSKFLPNLTMDFLDESTVVTCGFDMNPHIYKRCDDGWEFVKKLDEEKAEKKKELTGTSAAFSKFKSQDKKGTSKKDTNPILTHHKNTILGVIRLSATQFTTCGVDGRILVWNL